MRPGAAADLAAIDAAVALVWARAANGEMSFEAAHELDLKLRAARRIARMPVSKITAAVLEQVGLGHLATDRSAIAKRRGAAGHDAAERKERALRRKAVGNDAFSAGLILDRFAAADIAPPTDSDRAVAAVIAQACVIAGECTMAVATIAERAFVSVRSVQNALGKLRAAGLVVVDNRKIGTRRNLTNRIVVRDETWRRHLIETAIVRRIRKRGVVQTFAGEIFERNKKSNIPSGGLGADFQDDGAGGSEEGQPGQDVPDPPDAGRADRRLDRVSVRRMLELAGSSADDRSIALLDDGPLRGLLRQGCTIADLEATIRGVAARHSANGWRGHIKSWRYIEAPALKERDRRLAVAEMTASFDDVRMIAVARSMIDLRAEGIRDLSRLASLLAGGATRDDVIAAFRMVARRRAGKAYAPIGDWSHFRGAVADVVRDRLREEAIDREFADFWAMGWPECESDKAKSRRVFGTLREAASRLELTDAISEAADRVSPTTRASVVIIKAGKIIEGWRVRAGRHRRRPP